MFLGLLPCGLLWQPVALELSLWGFQGDRLCDLWESMAVYRAGEIGTGTASEIDRLHPTLETPLTAHLAGTAGLRGERVTMRGERAGSSAAAGAPDTASSPGPVSLSGAPSAGACREGQRLRLVSWFSRCAMVGQDGDVQHPSAGRSRDGPFQSPGSG